MTEAGIRPRLAWWHPSLTDYRQPLFERMAGRFELRLVLMRPGVPLPDALAGADVHLSRRAARAVASQPGHLVWRDLWALLYRIRRSEVFLSSFSLNLYSLAGLAWARLHGVPVVLWEEMQRLPRQARFAGLRLRLLEAVARRVDAYYVMGAPQRELLQSLGVPAGRIFESAEAADARLAATVPKPLNLPFAEGRPMLLFLGRLIPIKGVEVLLEAFAALHHRQPDATLALAGEGPLRAALLERAARLGIADAVVFLGHVAEPAHKAWLLQRAHALVVPSVYLGDWGEGGPLVIPEALSAGTPVICTEACGNTVAHVRRVGHGAVVPPSDPQALAEALWHALRKAPDRMAVRRAALALPDHDHQADTLVKAIEHALARPARARG